MSVDRPTKPGSREPATVRIAMWSARHRWPVVGLWFVATIGTLAISIAMGGIRAMDANEDPNERQLEASEAYELFNAGGTNDPTNLGAACAHCQSVQGGRMAAASRAR